MIYGARARLNWPRGPYQSPRIAAAGARIAGPAAQLAGHCRRAGITPGFGIAGAGKRKPARRYRWAGCAAQLRARFTSLKNSIRNPAGNA